MKSGDPIKIVLSKFYEGLALAWHKNSNAELGNAGQANAMTDCDTLDPTVLTQGPGKSSLGAPGEIINFIMQIPVSNNVAYALGATKIHKLSATALVTGGSPSYPQAVTNMTDGESIFRIGAYLYAPHNKSSGGDIARLTIADDTLDNDWGSTVPAVGAAALQSAPHPADSKEDIGVIGNGRYVCTYHADDDTLDVDKLDFKAGNEVVDVKFHANKWWLAVNSPNVSGDNRCHGRIYLWGADALQTTLEDEIDLGEVRIGFLALDDGEMIVCYQDLTDAGGYKIGVLSGRSIDPMTIKQFTGSLPNFAQHTKYKNGIAFLSSGTVYWYGASEPGLPKQIIKLASTDYSTTMGGLGAPFGTPYLASDNGSSYALSKFSGYSTAMNWTALTFEGTNIADDGTFLKASIDKILVLTNHLGSGARMDLNFQFNQNQGTAISKSITTAGKRFHEININQKCEDFRINLSASNGSASNNVGIRKIVIYGHWVGS